MKDEICRCGRNKLPFDVTCDDCHYFDFVIPANCKVLVLEALITLGYKYQCRFDKNEFVRDGSCDRYVVRITANRKDVSALTDLLNDVIK